MSRSDWKQWSKGKPLRTAADDWKPITRRSVMLTASELQRRGLTQQPSQQPLTSHLARSQQGAQSVRTNTAVSLSLLTGADGMVTLTPAMLDAMSTERGGYTKATMLALGVEWDDVHHSGFKGWKRALVGQRRPAELVKKLINGAKAPKLFG